MIALILGLESLSYRERLAATRSRNCAARLVCPSRRWGADSIPARTCPKVRNRQSRVLVNGPDGPRWPLPKPSTYFRRLCQELTNSSEFGSLVPAWDPGSAGRHRFGCFGQACLSQYHKLWQEPELASDAATRLGPGTTRWIPALAFFHPCLPPFSLVLLHQSSPPSFRLAASSVHHSSFPPSCSFVSSPNPIRAVPPFH